MAEKQVVRQDVIQIVWDVEKSPFGKIDTEIKSFQSSVGKAVTTTESKFDKLTNSVNQTQKQLSKMKLADKLQSDIDLADRALGKVKATAKSTADAFKKLVGNVKEFASQNVQNIKNGLQSIKATITSIVPKAKAFVSSIKDAANQKITNTVNGLKNAKNVLTQGQKGAKGFANALKNVGKIGLAKTIKSVKSIKDGFANAKNSVKTFGSSVKTAFGNAFTKAKTSAQKLLSSIKNINKESLNKIISGVNNLTKKLGSGVVAAAKKAGQAIKAMATAGVAALGAGVTAGVNYNSQIETYQTSFEVMTGSAAKAKSVVSQLQKMGAETPFEMTDLASTTQLLMNYGFTADDAISRMSMLGDISQGNADKMNSIATAYGQMSSAGKVSLEDVKQMIEAGFNPLQEISTTTGESMSSLYDRISDGTISVDEITASMQRSTSVGGKYYQSMEKQSKTFSGQLSTMKDNFQQLLGSMTSGIFNKLAKGVMPKINDLLGELSSAFERGGFAGVFNTLTQKLGPVGTALQNIVNKVKAFVSNNEKMQLVKDIFGKIKSIAGNVASVLGRVVEKVWDFVTSTGFLEGVKKVFSAISKAAGWVSENLDLIIEIVIPLVAGLATFVGVIKIISAAMTVWSAIQFVLNSALLACPITWIILAIVALVAIIVVLVRHWDKVKEAALKCWDKIKSVWSGVKDWFSSKVVTPVKKFFVDLWDKVPEPVKDVVGKIADGFQWAYDKVTGIWEGIKDFFSGIWEDTVKAVAKPVNKLIDGANWVLEKVGSDKKFNHWEPYARGTDGHPGGNAIVNDGRGAELVQMPNGSTFIPKGKNVGIPNAPKGMRVLDAQRTAQLMGKSGPTFHYENGSGGWLDNVFDFFDNAGGLVGKVIDKFVSFTGVGGIALDIGKGLVNTAKDAMVDWVKSLFEKFGGKSAGSYDASKGVEQWRSTVSNALKMEGLHTADNVERTLYQMQTESGGNPYAVNNWDINAKNGTPSKGLMQVIDPTFKSYARTGYNKDIFDPMSNILASVRYARSRYGSLEKAYRGVGYANGVGRIVLPEYKPGSSVSNSNTSNTSNSYAPSFNLTMNGTVDRTTERTIKKWVKEALEDMFDSISRTSPRSIEV